MRATLDAWVRELLSQLTAPGPDARTLDEISTTEILDMAYMQGAPLEGAIAAHALFPQYVEESERIGGPSSMSVTYPLRVTADDGVAPRVKIRVRWGQASALQIGEGGRGKVVNPTRPVPTELRSPRIGATLHELGEPGGDRLRAIAGPMRVIEHPIEIELRGHRGDEERPLASAAGDVVYGFVNDRDQLQVSRDASGGLLPAAANRRSAKTYLWGETRPAAVTLRVAWSRGSAGRLALTVTLRNVTPRREEDRAAATTLAALLMPHVRIETIGAEPDLPPLQYGEAKRSMLRLQTEEQRREEASRRLYEMRQSGCIATRSPVEPTSVLLTTFGIFDTPREASAPGPEFASLVENVESFLAATRDPSEAVMQLVQSHWPTVAAVFKAASAAFGLRRLHLFQWEAIQRNLELVASRDYRKVTVVRAPTGAGKTVVFLVNAAISALCGTDRGTAVLMFPTRLLNEDMFRRLTAFVHRMRSEGATREVTGGLLMGTSDPLYRVLLNPNPGEPMHHFGGCPACGATPLVAAAVENRMVPQCASCGHRVSYMYTSRDVPAFLPDLVIATPDKLFYEATAASFEQFRIGMFGAPVRRCTTCGRACPEAYLLLKPDAMICSNFHRQTGCPGRERSPSEVRAIAYMGFDEVHSLYGVTATFLSMFLADLEVTQAALTGRRVGVRYETATATISNEQDLIEALTRRRAAAGEIVLIPPEGAEGTYFRVEDGTVRHRVLVTLPTKMSSKQAFIRATLNARLHLREARTPTRGRSGAGRVRKEPAPAGELVNRLAQHSQFAGDWSFLLGYLFKKQEGADMKRALRDMYRNAFGGELRVEFLSGESPKDQISQILPRALSGEIDILLANLVISLGVDIHGLNHMIMLGVPQGFTEFVQTAGRTGRGRSNGHVQIVLQPFNPRDDYLYRHFHAVLSDVTGYYDILPVKSTNLHCAGEMFGNVAKSVLTSLCFRLPEPRWAHVDGVQHAVRSLPRGREQVVSGIGRILCDDPTLRAETDTLVETRLRALEDQHAARGGFLSEVMGSRTDGWLIWSLRGRSGSTVRVACVDEDLMDRLRAPGGGSPDDAEDGDA